MKQQLKTFLFAVSCCMLLVCLLVDNSSLAAEPTQLGDGIEQRIPFGRSAAGQPLWAYRLKPATTQAKKPADVAEFRLLIIDRTNPAIADNSRRTIKQWTAAEAEVAAKRAEVTLIPASDRSNPIAKIWKFPPAGKYYNHAENVELQYLWRWIGTTGFDLVVVLRNDHQEDGIVLSRPTGQQKDSSLPPASSGCLADPLCLAVSQHAVAGIGTIPAATLFAHDANWQNHFRWLIKHEMDAFSAAHLELVRRSNRSPQQLIEELSAVYGNRLDSVQYIPSVAVLARLRAAVDRQDEQTISECQHLLEPYLSGKKTTLPDQPNGSHLAGHLVFAEWHRLQQDERAIPLIKRAADFGFDASGQPLPMMPFHNEMSDAIFMGCPILVAAGAVTGETKYFEQAERHLVAIQKLCLREDGLYRHSPLNAAAWGRGNGFPVLGLALCLEYLPRDHRLWNHWRDLLEQHLNALLPHQDENGMWHQMIDRPESYAELTCTCMIGYAIQKGLNSGWWDAQHYSTAVEQAWKGVRQRVGKDGQLIDVCTGTGKQPQFEDYYYREAILGRDDRGGAMVLLFASEMLPRKKSPR